MSETVLPDTSFLMVGSGFRPIHSSGRRYVPCRSHHPNIIPRLQHAAPTNTPFRRVATNRQAAVVRPHSNQISGGNNMRNWRNLLTVAGSGALASLLSSTRRTIAQVTNNTTTHPATDTSTVPSDPLRGVYVPFTSGPDLDLPGINLSAPPIMERRFTPCSEYLVLKTLRPNREQRPDTPIGNFYAQLGLAMSESLSKIKIAIGYAGNRTFSPRIDAELRSRSLRDADVFSRRTKLWAQAPAMERQ